jgi:hypothetical protein
MSDPIWSLPVAELDRELAALPSAVTWSRLEPLALTSDLTAGLQTLLGDPLWLIGRQWQFGELQGEDAGTPISAIAEIEQAPLSRLRRGSSGLAVDLVDESVPLEARVEAEPVPVPAERVRAEAGLQLLRRLAGAGLQLRTRVLERWGFDAAASPVLAGRVPDGEQAAADLRPLADPGGGPLTGLPGGFGDAPAAARTTFADWLRWYDGYFVRGDGTAWDPHRQEYAFAVQAELPSGAVQLTAEEYTTGRLDWPDVDATLGTLGPAPAGRIGSLARQVRLPVPAGFPGMPADRLWQFEDARVYLGALDAGPTDLARLALVEFSLAYGVDWFVLPVDLVAGSVYWLHQLEIIDTFATAVSVGSARDGGWSMFGLGRPGEQTFVADVLALPPVVPHVLESAPLEEVALLRDEMANLVWGVERVVQGADGRAVDRNQQVAKVVSRRQTVPGDLADAAIVYRLMTPVPDNWVPFVAVPAPGGGVELERRPLLHFRDDGTTDVTHPLGVLLNEGGRRLRLAEEEVPRDGAVVTRRYQMARTSDGGTALWIGRRKRVGGGEGWSGLRFDIAMPPSST